MDEKTVRSLNAINRSFYDDFASAFSETRRDPWPGWERLPGLLGRHGPGPVRILDLGCGNGRLGAYLADALPESRSALDFTGIDASAALLDEVHARRLPIGNVRTECIDLVSTPIAAHLGKRRFALIALFGLIHHLPSERRRRELLASLARHLEPGGILAFAVWRFEAFERFRTKVRPWREFNAGSPDPIDEGQLEPGDHLLPWGAEGSAVRYCHFVDDAEAERLVQATNLQIADRYVADGREGSLNRYFLLRMAGGSSR
jgi:SAM-dependent methyltransferase